MRRNHEQKSDKQKPSRDAGHGWGKRLKPNELREVSLHRTAKLAEPVILENEATELKQRLCELHKMYFPEKKGQVTFLSIGLKSIAELKKLFDQYDWVRNRKSRVKIGDSSKYLAVLLGLKKPITA